MYFLDTSAILAIFAVGDPHHTDAAERWTSLVSSGEAGLTTNYVALEATALLQRRMGLAAMEAFNQAVVPMLKIHWVQQQDQELALRELMNNANHNLSLVDCVSFVAMRKYSVNRAFAYDRHFREQGFSCDW